MGRQAHTLIPLIPAAMLTLAGCSLEAELHYSDGSCDTFELPAADLLPLVFCCLATLVLLAQCFIPRLRRLYTAVLSTAMKYLRIERHREQRATLLANGTARLLFCFGLCMLPLCLAVCHDTFHHTLGGGPSLFPPLFFPILLTCFLMMVATLLMGIWLVISWQNISRVEKVNPVAMQLARRQNR